MIKHFIIRDGEVRLAPLLVWARWSEHSERRVLTTNLGPVLVSTIFLGLDHQYGEGPPLIFETMLFHSKTRVFDGPFGPRRYRPEWTRDEQTTWRYSTMEEAKRGHRVIVERVREFHSKSRVRTTEFETGKVLARTIADSR